MNSNMLFVPFRLTKDVNLHKELRRVIKKDYFQAASMFDGDLTQLHKLRKKVSNLSNETADKATEIFLKQYYIQLVNLQSKFPDEVIEFQWFGTLGYRPSGPYKIRSIVFEQVNFVYQLGSLYSQLGLRESRHTDEGLRKSCSYFQLAAGSFDFLIKLVEHLQQHETYRKAITEDFGVDTLKSLKYTMLAQAQETIWQKAVNSDMKNSPIIKLSIETSNIYYKAWEYGKKSDFVKTEILNHLYIKYYHFKAAAYYRNSLICLDSQRYGDQVANLRMAAKTIRSGAVNRQNIAKIVMEDYKGLYDTIEEALRVAEKDNDLIYMKPVPALEDLPAIKGASMVQPSVISELENPLQSDRLLLRDLLPYTIIKVALAYRERQDNFIMRNILQPLQSLNKTIVQFLAERQLPASIDSIQKPENLPESIIHHSKDIISMGGTQWIEDSYDTILQMSSDCRDLYEGCQQRLVIEMEEDEILREKYPSWNRPKSSELTEELWRKVNSMDEYLTQADRADEIILANYHEIKEYLELYCGGYDALIKFIPSSTYVNLSQEVATVVNDIRTAMNDTLELEQTRKTFLQTLQHKSKDNNILPKLIEEYKQHNYQEVTDETFEHVYSEHMRMFKADFEFVEAAKNKQIVLENRINELNQLFLQSYKSDGSDANSHRRETLQLLEDIYSQFIQLITNLNEAAKFYNDFKTRGTKVLDECEEFIHKRRNEASDYEQAVSAPPQTSPDKRIENRAITPVPMIASPLPRPNTSTPANELHELQHFSKVQAAWGGARRK